MNPKLNSPNILNTQFYVALNGLLIFSQGLPLEPFFLLHVKSGLAASSAEFCHLTSSLAWSEFITSPANMLVQRRLIFWSDESVHLSASVSAAHTS